MQVQSLGWEDTLEKRMATHSSILAWEVLYRGAWQAIVHGLQSVGHYSAMKQQQHVFQGRKDARDKE